MSPLPLPIHDQAEPTLLAADGDDLYGRGLLEAAAGSTGSAALAAPGWRVRASGGRSEELPLRRWCGGLSPVDETLLDRCQAPVLDVGCGPGRLTAGLVRRGVRCLGVDRSPVAVGLTERRGAPVLRRCLFETLPGEGRWATVLLADGNIGIGGDVERLLRRLAEVASPHGRIIAEVGAPASRTGPVRLRLEADGGRTGRWFPWAHLAVDDAPRMAGAAGLEVADAWSGDGRWFVELAR